MQLWTVWIQHEYYVSEDNVGNQSLFMVSCFTADSSPAFHQSINTTNVKRFVYVHVCVSDSYRLFSHRIIPPKIVNDIYFSSLDYTSITRL